VAWVAVAVAGSAVVGAAVSSNSASKARKSAANAASNDLGFAQAQYNDWLDAFGDIQTNLSDYYEALTPAFLETQGLQAFEQEKAQALDGLRTTLEQRGIATSGLAADIERDVAINSASERARIRAEAPIKSAQVQQEFLQIGLGQNPANNVQQALSSRTAQLSADSRLATRAAGQATGAAVDSTFDALQAILDRPTGTTTVGAPMGNPNNTTAASTA